MGQLTVVDVPGLSGRGRREVAEGVREDVGRSTAIGPMDDRDRRVGQVQGRVLARDRVVVPVLDVPKVDVRLAWIW